MQTFIAGLLPSVYGKVLYRGLHSADAPDTHNQAIACATSRNKFRKIFPNLYLADNSLTIHDGY